MRRHRIALLLVSSLAVAACGTESGSGQAATEASARSATTTHATSTEPPSTTALNPVSGATPSGIVVVRHDFTAPPIVETVGVVDAESGRLQIVSNFSVKELSVYPLDGWTSRRLFTPDLARMAATRTVAGKAHAGWVDRSGTFTDVTAALTAAVPDSFRSAPEQSAIGFGPTGDFYFYDHITSTRSIVRAGASSAEALPIAPKERADWDRDGNLTPLMLDTGNCDSRHEGWIDSATVLRMGVDGKVRGSVYAENGVRGNMIFAVPISELCYRGAGTRPLIPATTNRISGATLRPDHRSLAFVADNESSVGLFVTDMDSTTPPRRIGTTDLRGFRPVAWN